MVLLPDATAPDLRAAVDGLASLPAAPSITGVEVQENVATAQIPGGMLALAHMPLPIPAGELEGPAAVAWHWPDAAAAAREHAGHVIVHAASTELGSLELRLLHTHLVAALLRTAGGAGVYVGDAMLLRSAEDYLAEAQAASREALPLMLWIGFNPVREDGHVSAYTTGLSGFGFLELEVRRSGRAPGELIGALADAANYQLSTGKVLGDGETFGFSRNDRRRIRHTTSEFIPGARVALLEG